LIWLDISDGEYPPAGMSSQQTYVCVDNQFAIIRGGQAPSNLVQELAARLDRALSGVFSPGRGASMGKWYPTPLAARQQTTMLYPVERPVMPEFDPLVAVCPADLVVQLFTGLHTYSEVPDLEPYNDTLMSAVHAVAASMGLHVQVDAQEVLQPEKCQVSLFSVCLSAVSTPGVRPLAWHPGFIHLDGISLDMRGWNGLEREGMGYVGELFFVLPETLRQRRNMGKRTLIGIEEGVGAVGCKVGQHVGGSEMDSAAFQFLEVLSTSRYPAEWLERLMTPLATLPVGDTARRLLDAKYGTTQAIVLQYLIDAHRAPSPLFFLESEPAEFEDAAGIRGMLEGRENPPRSWHKNGMKAKYEAFCHQLNEEIERAISALGIDPKIPVSSLLRRKLLEQLGS